MRILLFLWAAPLVLFWGWYFVSLNDWNFGYVMLTRDMHDVLFQLYGQMLGIDPALLPGLLAKALVFDSLLLGCVVAFRKRKLIAERIRTRRRLRYASGVDERRSA